MAKTNYPERENGPMAKRKNLMTSPALDLGNPDYDELLLDLQANILTHHRKPFITYHFLQFTVGKEAEVKKWLQDIAPHLTNAKEQLLEGKKPGFNIQCLYLSYSGYEYLGFENSLIVPAGLAFQHGMEPRVRFNISNLQHELNADQNYHAVITIASDTIGGSTDSEPYFEQKLDALFEALVDKKFTQKGQAKSPLPEEYDFKDGISNPQFFPGATFFGKKTSMKQDEVSPLDIVLAPDKGGNSSYSFGSYAAFLKLEIDEMAIPSLEAKLQKALPNQSPEFVRATVIGRFQDGTPLTLSDMPNGREENDFNYKELIKVAGQQVVQDDSAGVRCPHYAHIRKANPRSPEFKNIRIVRRGSYYEEPNKEEIGQPNKKGMLFLSFQNSLETQFETILNNWMLNSYSYKDAQGNLQNIGHDMLLYQTNAEYTVAANWNEIVDNDHPMNVKKINMPGQFITFKGGLYLFAPSISFFKKLCPPELSVLERTKSQSPFLPGTGYKIKRPPLGPSNSPLIPGTEIILEKIT
jgi:deferrochelatase/peroxidase EfeB